MSLVALEAGIKQATLAKRMVNLTHGNIIMCNDVTKGHWYGCYYRRLSDLYDMVEYDAWGSVLLAIQNQYEDLSVYKR